MGLSVLPGSCRHTLPSRLGRPALQDGSYEAMHSSSCLHRIRKAPPVTEPSTARDGGTRDGTLTLTAPAPRACCCSCTSKGKDMSGCPHPTVVLADLCFSECGHGWPWAGGRVACTRRPDWRAGTWLAVEANLGLPQLSMVRHGAALHAVLHLACILNQGSRALPLSLSPLCTTYMHASSASVQAGKHDSFLPPSLPPSRQTACGPWRALSAGTSPQCVQPRQCAPSCPTSATCPVRGALHAAAGSLALGGAAERAARLALAPLPGVPLPSAAPCWLWRHPFAFNCARSPHPDPWRWAVPKGFS